MNHDKGLHMCLTRSVLFDLQHPSVFVVNLIAVSREGYCVLALSCLYVLVKISVCLHDTVLVEAGKMTVLGNQVGSFRSWLEIELVQQAHMTTAARDLRLACWISVKFVRWQRKVRLATMVSHSRFI